MPRLPVTCRSAPSDSSSRAVDSSPWKHAHYNAHTDRWQRETGTGS